MSLLKSYRRIFAHLRMLVKWTGQNTEVTKEETKNEFRILLSKNKTNKNGTYASVLPR